MVVRTLHRFIYFLILILFSLPSYAEGTDTLLLRAGIKPIKGNPMAPNFFLEDLHGKKVELKHFRGKVVLISFWATWCGPCKEEMPSKEVLRQMYKGKNFALLAISVDYDEKKKVKDFIDKHRYSFPVLIDPQCITLDLYGIKGIPATILIDKKGRMVGRSIGPKDWKGPEILSLLNYLLEN